MTAKDENHYAWAQYIPGLLGGLWLVACIGYVFWAKVLSPGLTVLAKVVVSAICVSGLAFVASGFAPLKGYGQVRPDEIGNFWAFLRGNAPMDPVHYALWWKFRRTMGILLVTLVLMAVWGVVVSLGFAKAP